MQKERWCEWCGGSFVVKDKRQRFCNSNCQSAHSRKRREMMKTFYRGKSTHQLFNK